MYSGVPIKGYIYLYHINIIQLLQEPTFTCQRPGGLLCFSVASQSHCPKTNPRLSSDIWACPEPARSGACAASYGLWQRNFKSVEVDAPTMPAILHRLVDYLAKRSQYGLRNKEMEDPRNWRCRLAGSF